MRRRYGDRPDGTVGRRGLLGAGRRPTGVRRGNGDNRGEQPGGQRDGREQRNAARKLHVGARKNGVRIADVLRRTSTVTLEGASKYGPNTLEARLHCSTYDN